MRAADARLTAANMLGVTTPWLDTAFGCILFVLLSAAGKYLTVLRFDSPDVDAAAGRLLALAAFALAQQLAFLPASDWLRFTPANRPADRRFDFSPLEGVTFGFIFAVPLATAAQLAGIDWVPPAQPFPEADGALLRLVVAPLSDELFFRAWLLTAFAAAGEPPAGGLLASTVLFGLYNVPLSEALRPDGTSLLLLYEAFGAYLAFLYQRSGGNLPLVFVTHATCNWLVLALRAAQVGSVLPF